MNTETEKLFQAIKDKESIETIKGLLVEAVDLSATNAKKDDTPINAAVDASRLDVIKAIAKFQSTSKKEDTFHYASGLLYAVKMDNYDTVYALLKAHSPDERFYTSNGFCSLHWAVKNNNPKMIQLLLQYNNKRHVINLDEQTPLDLACELKHWECARQLLKDRKFKFENKIKAGLAFIQAVRYGQLDIADELISAGAVTNSVTQIDNNTALHHVILRWQKLKNNEKTLVYVLAHGGDQTATNNDNKTAIELASQAGHWDCVRLLLGNCKTYENLHLHHVLFDAIKEGNHMMVEVLLKKGVSCNMIDDDGNKALHLAIKCNHPKIVSMLLKRGANPKYKDKNGNNSLKQAKLFDHVDCILHLNKKTHQDNDDSDYDNEVNEAIHGHRIVKNLSTRIHYHDNTDFHPDSSKTFLNYSYESKLCYQALNINSIPAKHITMVIRHVLFCDLNILELLGDSLIASPDNEVILRKINTALSNPHQKELLTLFYPTATTDEEKYFNNYLMHLQYFYDYVERITAYLQQLKTKILTREEKKNWEVRDFNPFNNSKWKYGLPSHISYAKQRLENLPSKAFTGKVLNIYCDILEHFPNSNSSYRAKTTKNFDHDEKKIMESVVFIKANTMLPATSNQFVAEQLKLNSYTLATQIQDKSDHPIENQKAELFPTLPYVKSEHEYSHSNAATFNCEAISHLSYTDKIVEQEKFVPGLESESGLDLEPVFNKYQVTTKLYPDLTEYKPTIAIQPNAPVLMDIEKQVASQNTTLALALPPPTRSNTTSSQYPKISDRSFAELFPAVVTDPLPSYESQSQLGSENVGDERKEERRGMLVS